MSTEVLRPRLAYQQPATHRVLTRSYTDAILTAASKETLKLMLRLETLLDSVKSGRTSLCVSSEWEPGTQRVKFSLIDVSLFIYLMKASC